jgi:hypothetical protein
MPQFRAVCALRHREGAASAAPFAWGVLTCLPTPNCDTAHAECTPLHKGRSTMVWQTRVTRNDGKLCAIVTQTQIVIPAGKTS